MTTPVFEWFSECKDRVGFITLPQMVSVQLGEFFNRTMSSCELKRIGCHDDNFINTACTGSCHDNLRWRKKVVVVTAISFFCPYMYSSYPHSKWNYEDTDLFLNQNGRQELMPCWQCAECCRFTSSSDHDLVAYEIQICYIWANFYRCLL